MANILQVILAGAYKPHRYQGKLTAHRDTELAKEWGRGGERKSGKHNLTITHKNVNNYYSVHWQLKNFRYIKYMKSERKWFAVYSVNFQRFFSKYPVYVYRFKYKLKYTNIIFHKTI